jgi:hypothetical protein
MHDIQARLYKRGTRVRYCLAIGDLLSWSSFYDGTGSRVLWWSSSACEQRLCKLWLVVVESQKTVPKKET